MNKSIKEVAYDKEVDATYQHGKMTEMMASVKTLVDELDAWSTHRLTDIWKTHEYERYDAVSRRKLGRLRIDIKRLSKEQWKQAYQLIREQNPNLFRDVDSGTITIELSQLSRRTIHQLCDWIDFLKRKKLIPVQHVPFPPPNGATTQK